MVARARSAPPAAVLAGSGVAVALLWFALSVVSVLHDAPLVLLGSGVGVLLAVLVFSALQWHCRTGSVTGLTFAWIVSVAMLPLAVLGVSFGGFSMLPTGALLICACGTVRAPARAAERESRTTAQVGIAAFAAIAVYAAWVAFSHAGDAIYGAPGWARPAIVVVVLLGLGGAATGIRSERPALTVSIVAGVAMFGFLMSASLLFAFPLAGVPLVLLGLALARRPQLRGVTSGPLLGISLPTLAVAALAAPLVDCRTGDAGPNIWVQAPSLTGATMSSGSATSHPDGRLSGRASGPGYDIRYVCDGGRLTHFRLSR